jgi:acyl-CoA synthetase (AMP-forming)/AMP-acid ligase II
MLTHANLLANIEMIVGAGAQAEDRAVSWLPPYHDMGLIGGILEPIYRAGPVLLMSPVTFLQKPIRWLEWMQRYPGDRRGLSLWLRHPRDGAGAARSARISSGGRRGPGS